MWKIKLRKVQSFSATKKKKKRSAVPRHIFSGYDPSAKSNIFVSHCPWLLCFFTFTCKHLLFSRESKRQHLLAQPSVADSNTLVPSITNRWLFRMTLTFWPLARTVSFCDKDNTPQELLCVFRQHAYLSASSKEGLNLNYCKVIILNSITLSSQFWRGLWGDLLWQ